LHCNFRGQGVFNTAQFSVQAATQGLSCALFAKCLETLRWSLTYSMLRAASE